MNDEAHFDEAATISAVEPLAADPATRRIRVGRRVVARLRESEVERLGISAGAAWTEALAGAVARSVERERLRRIAMGLLARRGYSCEELAARLARRTGDALAPGDVVEQLRADGWIDDEAYARRIADSLVEKRPASAELVRRTLEARGIDGAAAERVARDATAGSSPIDAAEELARDLARRRPEGAPHVRARRIAGALSRRGFDDDVVMTVLARLGLDGAAP